MPRIYLTRRINGHSVGNRESWRRMNRLAKPYSAFVSLLEAESVAVTVSKLTVVTDDQVRKLEHEHDSLLLEHIVKNEENVRKRKRRAKKGPK